ncbi:MAG: TnsD family Tn7-like transposition protein [Clostridium sp.]
MPPFLPSPYPDEAFHSLIARYHIRSGNLIHSYTYRDLFSIKLEGMNTRFPYYLNNLVDKIANEEITTENLIEKHTLFPFFVAFNPRSRSKIKNYMMMGGRELNAFQSGFSLPNYYYQHCYNCIELDRKAYGETYWHRMHQLPGVFVCPIHKKPLLRVKEEIMKNVDNNYIIANEKEIFEYPDSTIVNKGNLYLLNLFAREAISCMTNYNSLKQIENYAILYKAALQEKGFTTRSGNDNKSLVYRLKEFYGDRFLNLLGSPINDDNYRASWVISLLHQSKLTNPVRHILLIIFLFGSIENIIEFKKKYNRPKDDNLVKIGLFGIGPWPCLNPAHTDYLKKTISEMNLKKTSRGHLCGIFKCSCGMVYSKKIQKGKGVSRNIKILIYGPIWEQKFKELIEKGYSKNSISKKLQVSFYTVSKKYDVLINGGSIASETYETFLKNRREQWLGLLKEKENVTSKTNPGLYQWLKRNDEEWFKDHLPAKRINKQNKTIRKKIDWEKRDLKLLNEVKDIMNNWNKREPYKPVKRTLNAIAKQTKSSFNIITRNKSKLPKTIGYINSVVEDSHQYACRRIEWAYSELKKENELITLTGLLRKSGTNNLLLASEFYNSKLRQ